jgi:hypothetical protein
MGCGPSRPSRRHEYRDSYIDRPQVVHEIGTGDGRHGGMSTGHGMGHSSDGMGIGCSSRIEGGGMGGGQMGGGQMSSGMPGGYAGRSGGRRTGRDAFVGGVCAEEERLVSREWMAVLDNRPVEKVKGVRRRRGFAG